MKKRRLQFFLLYGLSGTLTGLAMRLGADIWPDVPSVENSFFIAWWIGAAVGSMLISFGRVS